MWKKIRSIIGRRKVLAVLFVLWDFIAVHAAYIGALWARFDFVFSAIPLNYLDVCRTIVTPYAICTIVILALFKMYSSIWRYASVIELAKTFAASVLACQRCHQVHSQRNYSHFICHICHLRSSSML